MSTKDSGAKNPFTILLHQITGVGLAKPRKAQALALWAKANLEKIKEAKKQAGEGKHYAGNLNKIKSKLFKALPKEERDGWEVMSVEEFEQAEKEYEEKLNAPISTDLSDQQKYV